MGHFGIHAPDLLAVLVEDEHTGGVVDVGLPFFAQRHAVGRQLGKGFAVQLDEDQPQRLPLTLSLAGK